ncbi:P-loop containing nucleoside triphosphate hydrolase protein [Salix suchowensis]|nr:P-loop containing nucleoside triphosphate hydrolase protein [Salix suchowensis]
MAYEWPDVEGEQSARRRKRSAANPKASLLITPTKMSLITHSPPRCSPRVWHPISDGLVPCDPDEAQFIRNKTTRLADVYAYLRFIKLRPWYDWSEFHAHISRLEKKNRHISQLHDSAHESSELDGKRLIELPPKEVEAKTQATFNRYLRAGTVLKNYSQVLVLLLRLRQICSHPILIQEDGDGFVHPDEVDDDKPEVRTELTRARYLVSMDFVDGLKAKFKEAALKRIAAEKESVDAIFEDEECRSALITTRTRLSLLALIHSLHHRGEAFLSLCFRAVRRGFGSFLGQAQAQGRHKRRPELSSGVLARQGESEGKGQTQAQIKVRYSYRQRGRMLLEEEEVSKKMTTTKTT